MQPQRINEIGSSLLGSGDSDSSCLSSSTACTSVLFSDESLVVSDDSFLEEVKKSTIKRRVIKPRLSMSVIRNSTHRVSDSNSPVSIPIPRKSIALQSPLLESRQAKAYATSVSRSSLQQDPVLDSHAEVISHYSRWASFIRSLHNSLSDRNRSYVFFSSVLELWEMMKGIDEPVLLMLCIDSVRDTLLPRNEEESRNVFCLIKRGIESRREKLE